MAITLAMAWLVGGAAQFSRAEEQALPSTADSASGEENSSNQRAVAPKGRSATTVTTDEGTGLFGQFLDTLDGFYDERSANDQNARAEAGKIVILQQPQTLKANEVAPSDLVDQTEVDRTMGKPAARRSTRDKKSSSGGLLGSFFGSSRSEERTVQQTAPPAPQRSASSAHAGQQPTATGDRRQKQGGQAVAQQNRPQSSWMKRMLWPLYSSDEPAERPRTVARPRVSEPVARAQAEPARRVRERPVRVRPSLAPSVAIEFAQAVELPPAGPETEAQLAKSKVSDMFRRTPQPSPQVSVSVQEPALADVTPIVEDTHTIRITERVSEEERTPTLAEEYAKSEIRVAGLPPEWNDDSASRTDAVPMRPSEFASIQFESSVDALGLAQSLRDLQNGPGQKPSAGGGLSSGAAVRMARQPRTVR